MHLEEENIGLTLHLCPHPQWQNGSVCVCERQGKRGRKRERDFLRDANR